MTYRLPSLAAALTILAACPDPLEGPGADTAVGDDTWSDASALPDAVDVPDGVANDGVVNHDAPLDGLVPDVPPQPTTYTYNSECVIPADPSASGASVTFEPAFSGAGINGPLVLTYAGDGSGRIFVAERAGRVKVFAKQEPAQQATTFVDFVGQVDTGSEGGLLGLAFHPDYATNGYFFTSYTSSNVVGDGQFYNVLSRWRVSDSDPNVADPSSELILFTVLQTAKNHNGGDLKFGPDGYLYMSIGDGGPQGDPAGHGQNTATWLASIVRIDVDTPASVSTHYSIPADNPFATDTTGQVKEIYAWGFRNPWRMSFDRLTGALWVGDVGQGRIEEASIVTLGMNAGWRVLEGPECYNSSSCNAAGMKVPEVWYYHSVDGKEGGGRSITGGYVYRGAEVPALYGAYLYADWNVPNVWAYKHGEEPMPNPDDGSDALFVGPGQIGSFGEDADGEVYMLKLYGGEPIWRFVQVDNDAPPADFPQTLTQTGCFSDLSTMTPVAGVFSYGVNAPLWSDAADKERWFVLPDGATITYAPDGQWQFPEGTVFIKHFAVETEQGDPASLTRLETRFLVQGAGGQSRGYTYRWNDEGTEAYLLASGDSRELTYTPEGGDAQPLTWGFPSRAQCLSCHNSVVGGPLGPETGQLNRQQSYPELWTAPLNTIEALALYGLFENPPTGTPADWQRYPDLGDDGASVEDRARAYLHSNCANCHRADSAVGVPLDLRWGTPLGDMGACNEPPLKGDMGVPGAMILTPGEANASTLYRRIVTTDAASRMPPIGSHLVDTQAAQVIADWIDALTGCP